MALTPAGVRALVEAGPPRAGRARRRRRQRHRDEEYTRGRRRRRAWPRPLGPGRPDPQGQGADRRRDIRGCGPGQIALHLPAPGRRARADARPAGARRHRHRLRDGPAVRRQPAAAHAHERGGRAAGGAGRRALPRPGARRPGHPAGRRARSAATATSWSWAPAPSGVNAAQSAVGLGADVSVLDINLERLREVDDLFRGRVVTLTSNSFNLEQVRPARRSPRRRRAGRRRAGPGARHRGDGGGHEGGRGHRRRRGRPGRLRGDDRSPRPCSTPIYIVHGVLHYGVTNMPALVPRTSTFALTNATLPYALELAAGGARPRGATRSSPGA